MCAFGRYANLRPFFGYFLFQINCKICVKDFKYYSGKKKFHCNNTCSICAKKYFQKYYIIFRPK